MLFQLPEKSRQLNRQSEITVLLEKSCRLEGKLYFEGTARLDGQFEGEIETPDTLIIGREAQVKGQVSARKVRILGRFDGKISASQRVDVLPSAKVTGVVESQVFHLEEGAVFNGETKTLAESASCHLDTPRPHC